MKATNKYRPRHENKYNKKLRKNYGENFGNKTAQDYQDPPPTITFDLTQYQFEKADPKCKDFVCIRERLPWKNYKDNW